MIRCNDYTGTLNKLVFQQEDTLYHAIIKLNMYNQTLTKKIEKY